MSQIAIKVENLGKKYLLKHEQRESYQTFQDVLVNNGKKIITSINPFYKKSKITTDSSIEEFWALNDVNFKINQGDKVGVIGRNGAGKSTLLKVLSRITEPTTGKIHINGRIASLLEVGTGFHPELTGRENIYLNGAILGMTRAEIKRKFDEIVAFAEVEKFLDTPVKRYSSGMYVRLAFSVAAHLEPEILVVDEVLAVGDAEFQKKSLGKMEDVSKEGRTVLFVSHNMAVINKLCNKTIFLKNGKVAFYGDTSEAIEKYISGESHNTSTEKMIETHMRNKGGELVQFEQSKIASVDNELKKYFFIGEEIRLDIKFKSMASQKLSFWVIIFDSQGIAVYSSHQRDYEKLYDIESGMYNFTYTTKGLDLMPGRYTFTAGAFDQNIKFLEWIDECQDFEVTNNFISGKVFDGRWGYVNLKAEWKIEKL